MYWELVTGVREKTDSERFQMSGFRTDYFDVLQKVHRVRIEVEL